MTPDERERMNWLCKRIADEKDPKTFGELVHELNELLGTKQESIDPRHRPKPN